MAASSRQCCLNVFLPSLSPRLLRSCRGTDKRFRSQIDVIFLSVWLTTGEFQDVLLSGQLILCNDAIVDRPTVHTTPTLGPHLSKATFHVQQVVFPHEPMTT